MQDSLPGIPEEDVHDQGQEYSQDHRGVVFVQLGSARSLLAKDPRPEPVCAAKVKLEAERGSEVRLEAERGLEGSLEAERGSEGSLEAERGLEGRLEAASAPLDEDQEVFFDADENCLPQYSTVKIIQYFNIKIIIFLELKG